MTSDRWARVGGGLQPGLLLGPYRLQDVVGEGGMGVVIIAVDTKLQRPVAIKFLSTQIADAESRRRFQREAQLASSLNHPHIVTVHDVGEFDGSQYLVSEFVDGGTLKDWAAREPRSWRQVVDLLIGVADALATAHQAGILHRDVKPQNVLVAKNGYAKLADFGLAKMSDDAAHEAAVAPPETVTHHGVVVGTVAYMSPEQASGKPLDARTDVFSFGIVLYELLAGRRPFVGVSELEVLQNVIHGNAVPLGPEIPLPLRMIVEKALEKDAGDRYQSMRDLVVDLRRVARRRPEDSGQVAAGVTVRPARWARLGLAALAVVLAGVAGVAIGRGWANPPSPVEPTLVEPTHAEQDVRFQAITDSVGIEEMPAVSPDGKTIAFVAPLDGRQQIWVRLLAGGSALPITRDEVDHELPRWSPDSSAIVYFVPPTAEGEFGALWEVPALGGAPRRLASSTTGGDVSHDGRRVATFQKTGKEAVLTILGRDGMPSAQPIPIQVSDERFAAPRWSPDDRSIAFVSGVDGLGYDLYVMDLAAPVPKLVAHATSIQGFAWQPDGSGLVFASSSGSSLIYPPVFNLRAVSRDGQLERQLTVGDVSYVQPDIVRAGKLFASRLRMQSEIWGFPVSGSPSANVKYGRRVTQQTAQVQTPSTSPDGREIAYLSDSGGHANIWVAKTDGGSRRQLTFETDPTVVVGIPIWSPAGDRIVFIRNDPAGQAEWLINPDGSGQRKLKDDAASAAWSGDGRWLYYQTSGAPSCIEKMPADGGPSVRVRCDAAVPAPSADGATLYFSPRAFLNANEIHKASPEGGAAVPLTRYARSRVPFWPTGHALSRDGRWIATPLKDGPTTNIWAIPTSGGPFRQLTDFGRRAILIARQVSWSPDGKTIYAAVAEIDADIVLLDGIPTQTAVRH